MLQYPSLCVQSGVTSTPLNPLGRVSLEGNGSSALAMGQAPGVSYRLVKFDSSSSNSLENPSRFMLSGESVMQATPLFKPADLVIGHFDLPPIVFQINQSLKAGGFCCYASHCVQCFLPCYQAC